MITANAADKAKVRTVVFTPHFTVSIWFRISKRASVADFTSIPPIRNSLYSANSYNSTSCLSGFSMVGNVLIARPKYSQCVWLLGKGVEPSFLSIMPWARWYTFLILAVGVVSALMEAVRLSAVNSSNGFGAMAGLAITAWAARLLRLETETAIEVLATAIVIMPTIPGVG